MYGRYEYKDDRSDKFWQIKKLPNGNALAEWGRNGHSPQGSKEYTSFEVAAKVNEKIAKGYQLKTPGTIGPRNPKRIPGVPPTGRAKKSESFDFMEELKKCE